MKITESEFREIVSKKLREKLLIFEATPRPKKNDAQGIKDFRKWVNQDATRMKRLEAQYTIMGLNDKKLDYEGDNLSGTNRWFMTAWNMFGQDWDGTDGTASKPKPQPEQKPDEKPPGGDNVATQGGEGEVPKDKPDENKPPESKPDELPPLVGVGQGLTGAADPSKGSKEGTTDVGIGDSEKVKLAKYDVMYSDGDTVAFQIALPLDYMKFTPGGEKRGIFQPRTLQKIRKGSSLPLNQRQFVVRFGGYRGENANNPDSLFNKEFFDIEEIKKFTVRGPGLNIKKTKGTDFYENYEFIDDILNYLTTNNNLLDEDMKDFQENLVLLRNQLVSGKFDILKVVVKGKPDIQKVRFEKNDAANNVKKALDNIWIAKKTGKLSIEKVQKAIQKAKKDKQKIKLQNIPDITLSESKSFEKEFSKVLKSIASKELKKKVTERLASRDLTTTNVRDLNTGPGLPKGKPSLALSSIIGLGLANEMLDKMLGKDLVFADTDGDDFRRPLAVASTKITSKPQKNRVSPVDGKVRDHSGVDLRTGGNVRVMSISSGEIKEINRDASNSCGLYVTVDHRAAGLSLNGNSLLETMYCHLSSIDSSLSIGGSVSAGSTLGISGDTGRSDGPHLHLSIKCSGLSSSDPTAYLAYFEAVTDGAYDETDMRSEEEKQEDRAMQADDAF